MERQWKHQEHKTQREDKTLDNLETLETSGTQDTDVRQRKARKNAYFTMHYIPTESSLFGVAKYQILFTDKNSQTYSSQKEVK